MRITIATRFTNRGGVTDVVAQEPVVERRERGKDIILQGEGSELYVLKEVSNSDRHTCRVMTLDGRTVGPTEIGIDCVCEQPQKALRQAREAIKS